MTGTGWQTTWVRASLTLAVAALMAMIFCFSTENAEQSDRRSGTVSWLVISVLHPSFETYDPGKQQKTFEDISHAVRKSAHFSEYALLGFTLRLCLESWFGSKRNSRGILTLTALAAGTIYAVTDELHQLAVDGRTGQWTDVLLDAAGVILGAVLGMILFRHTSQKPDAGSDANGNEYRPGKS